MFSSIHIYFYVIPLVAAISLVYSGTRHESTTRILVQAARLFGVILGVLAASTAALLLVNAWV
ncbi:MAG: hypothetical protein SFX72_12190 [Isosphaeraceae bacterium]|nr:hypothetical protein [Isosphaeraceae bacterium]